MKVENAVPSGLAMASAIAAAQAAATAKRAHGSHHATMMAMAMTKSFKKACALHAYCTTCTVSYGIKVQCHDIVSLSS